MGLAPLPDDRDGDVERIGDVEVTHRFVDAAGSRYHLVTAGDPSTPAVLLLHGFPECWYAWHHQIADLAADRFVIAPDLKGYGQSEKRPDTSYTFAHGAFEMAVVLDRLGVDRFSLVGHDRGSVLADNLFGVPGVADRVDRYGRLQQSFPLAHGEPRPPHAVMASPEAPAIFGDPDFLRMVYRPEPIPGAHQVTFKPIDGPTLARIEAEWYRPGVADAVPRTFVHTDFDIEMDDREWLIPRMRCPIRLLQAELDPGQKPADYEGLEELGDHISIEWLADTGHFSHLESPELTTAALRRFLVDEMDAA